MDFYYIIRAYAFMGLIIGIGAGLTSYFGERNGVLPSILSFVVGSTLWPFVISLSYLKIVIDGMEERRRKDGSTPKI